MFDPTVLPAAMVGIPGGPLESAVDTGSFVEEIENGIEHDTGRLLEEAGVTYTARREIGHPVDRIVSVAHNEKSDVIVMGSRGLGGFERPLLGSVSEGVLRHAHCPVLAIR